MLQSVVRCLWHPKTNQLAVGLADGNVKILYDPDKSHRSVETGRGVVGWWGYIIGDVDTHNESCDLQLWGS